MVTACHGERQVTKNILHFKRAGAPVDVRQGEEEDVVGEAGGEINDGSGGQEDPVTLCISPKGREVGMRGIIFGPTRLPDSGSETLHAKRHQNE
ncbi:hypothetical protein NDU88_003081 [Pleurodeles waltl]|uniref:Uncharacterized protein n=1 Tax=Pleurodeles waltl TaxID=8319 RepID=A0AAV7V0A8_PLEWA|nr:hypothetical protein NDU88_003081 [Pleurodeles waltl]